MSVGSEKIQKEKWHPGKKIQLEQGLDMVILFQIPPVRSFRRADCEDLHEEAEAGERNEAVPQSRSANYNEQETEERR